jgi:hypothetical protein
VAERGGEGGQPAALQQLAAALLRQLCRLRFFPHLVGVEPEGGVSALSPAERETATWEMLAVLPPLVRLALDSCAADRVQAADVVTSMSAVLEACHVPVIASCEQAATWAAAAEAVLRLLPLLEAGQAVEGPVGAQAPGQGSDGGEDALERELAAFFKNMLPLLWGRTVEAIDSFANSGAAQCEALAALVQQLWGLHSACCRAMHWLLREPSRQRALSAQDVLLNQTDVLLAALSTQQAAAGAHASGAGQQRWAAPRLPLRAVPARLPMPPAF